MAGYTHICRTLGKRITAYCSLYWKFRRVFDNGDSREIESETEIPLIRIISRDDRADVIDSGNVKNNDDETTRRGVGNLIPTVAQRTERETENVELETKRSLRFTGGEESDIKADFTLERFGRSASDLDESRNGTERNEESGSERGQR
ncbi:hypothetical protein HZH68_016166 [Vespula germanica]|uniref:Uncharacterized protein n=1 Tax=Vespula germanica TaxID=30212 RepID=A0A834J3C1_VESGE|nr:hypothetical protein HZH68_016166 [Vespula germanica]